MSMTRLEPIGVCGQIIPVMYLCRIMTAYSEPDGSVRYHFTLSWVSGRTLISVVELPSAHGCMEVGSRAGYWKCVRPQARGEYPSQRPVSRQAHKGICADLQDELKAPIQMCVLSLSPHHNND